MKDSEKKLTINLTLSWTFTKKQWDEQQDFVKRVRENPRIYLGYDIVYSLDILNQIVYPDLDDIQVKVAE